MNTSRFTLQDSVTADEYGKSKLLYHDEVYIISSDFIIE